MSELPIKDAVRKAVFSAETGSDSVGVMERMYSRVGNMHEVRSKLAGYLSSCGYGGDGSDVGSRLHKDLEICAYGFWKITGEVFSDTFCWNHALENFANSAVLHKEASA